MADEIPVYQDENIRITNLRAMLHEKTYAMANITSVFMYTQINSKVPGVAVAAFGAMILLMGLVSRELRGCGIVLGLILAVVGIAYAMSQRNRYWVRIGSASGETNALYSLDRDYIVRIVSAMNEAIVRRG